jgi:AraC family transcriptional regulator
MDSSINPMTRVRDIEMSGFILTDFLQPSLFKCAKHYHECATILITLKGIGTDGMMGRVYECKPSNILIRPAGETHTHEYGLKGMRGLVIEVRPQKLETMRSFTKVLDQCGSFTESYLAELGMRLYSESLIMDSASEIAIEGLLLEMFAQVTRQNLRESSGIQPRWFKQALEFIHESYKEPINLSQVADEVKVHPSRLAQLFRYYNNCSVGEYIRRLRLIYAARGIMFSDISLAEISVAAGFYDQSHFTKYFKRYIGILPTELRAIARTQKGGAGIFPRL